MDQKKNEKCRIYQHQVDNLSKLQIPKGKESDIINNFKPVNLGSNLREFLEKEILSKS